MAVLTTAEKLYTAYLTGNEADFYSGGVRYEFTPEGLRDFISSSPTSVSWSQVTGKPTTFPTTPGAAVTDLSTGQGSEDIITAFNTLLASLRNAGLLEE